jgi:uncharacterized membrane protein
VCTVRAIAHWIATNFIVRVLSPQSAFEYCGLVGLIVAFVVLLVILVVVGGNLWSNTMFVRSMRENASAWQNIKKFAD